MTNKSKCKLGYINDINGNTIKEVIHHYGGLKTQLRFSKIKNKN